jgi:hypothetical protein
VVEADFFVPLLTGAFADAAGLVFRVGFAGFAAAFPAEPAPWGRFAAAFDSGGDSEAFVLRGAELAVFAVLRRSTMAFRLRTKGDRGEEKRIETGDRVHRSGGRLAMKLLLLVITSLGFLSACTLTPEPAQPSWTDARLSETPPGAVPGYVERAVIAPGERRSLDARIAQTLKVRDQVNTVGVRLSAPTVDTAEFVVNARRRGSPPPAD